MAPGPEYPDFLVLRRLGAKPTAADFAFCIIWERIIKRRRVDGWLRALAKNSILLHRSYKMLRDARSIPPGKLLHPTQVRAVYKVLPNTMLPMPRLFDAYEAVTSIKV